MQKRHQLMSQMFILGVKLIESTFLSVRNKTNHVSLLFATNLKEKLLKDNNKFIYAYDVCRMVYVVYM